MKLSSKSIFSPSHTIEPPQMSLSMSSSSLIKRPVNNGSINKGSQASPNPMFPSGGRKRGPGNENPHEPSSPKVTCIGQVRVKTMKQGKKMRGARSKRRGGGGEASFRRTEQSNFQAATNPDLSRQKSQKSQSFQHQSLQQECLSQRNQRWVHVPSAICEALRAFGAEFSCLFPCRSSCSREKDAVRAESGGSGGREASCEDAVGRWLVTLQEGDGAKGSEIELVMGDEEGTNCNSPEVNHRRRRHVFEDIDIDIEKLKNEEEEKARVSICIPPKNALLLMRCRSDPVKMAALANRFWEPSVDTTQEDEDGHENNGDEEEQVQMEEDFKQVHDNSDTVHDESEKGVVAFVGSGTQAKNTEATEVAEETNKEKQEAAREKEEEAIQEVRGEENDVVGERTELSSSAALPAPSEPQNSEVDEKGSTKKGTTEENPMEENGSKERESGTLPECLLLMMCEPKLSMEVSRETWVCSADFIRWLPPRPSGKTGGGDRQPKKRVAAEDHKPPAAPPQQLQPARSSCSFPAAATAAGPSDLEPSALKRCKSEPRKSAAKLAPEACSWNKRKLLGPNPQAQLGVGAAGIGF